NSAATPKEVSAEIAPIKSIRELRSVIAALKASEDEAKQTAGASLEGKLTTTVGTGDLDDAVADLLHPRIPTFFYYSEYSNLPSRLRIRELLQADPSTLTDELLTARSLLRLAATEDDYVLIPDYERRKRELQNVATMLT